MKKICCVNDMPGVGKIALAAMVPIISAEGIEVSTLPTALVSNTLDFGKFDILDTTDYMKNTVKIWEELGFKFDCISTGFMVNPRQVDIIKKLIENSESKSPTVVVDPIMGDEGKLYNGMSDLNVNIMRSLAAYADILIPNYTEACFLTDTEYCESISMTDGEELISGLRKLGAKSVVITSAKVDGSDCVIGYDSIKNKGFKIDFEMINARFPGTGDIFSAVLIGKVMNGKELEESVKCSMNTVRELIALSLHKKERFFGVDIEKYIARNI